MKCVLASASWDKTVKLWDMLDSWRTKETLMLNSDGNLYFILYKCKNIIRSISRMNNRRECQIQID